MFVKVAMLCGLVVRRIENPDLTSTTPTQTNTEVEAEQALSWILGIFCHL